MDIERGNLEILFKNIPFEEIQLINTWDKKSDWKHIEKELFLSMNASVFPSYTPDERENMYYDLMESVDKGPGVFGYLMHISKQLLCNCDDEVKCQYANILRWREISFQLGQDIFTCAYLAAVDEYERRVFSWRPIIQSDNNRLHNVLAKGMSENHFHLNGSTQIMELNWISLMNFVCERTSEFKKLKQPLTTREIYRVDGANENSLQEKCRKAALYRILLYEKLKNLEESKQGVTVEAVQKGEQEWNINALDDRIRTARHLYGYRNEDDFILDYCLESKNFDESYKQYRLLCGERKFLYQCFRAVKAGAFTEIYCNLFYRYLILKASFRSEMIQINRRVGFQNFSEYQDRKEIFIERYIPYCKEAIRIAIHATMRDQNINSLEARICPKEDPVKLLSSIKFNTDIIKEQPEKERGKTFFVLHFPKEKEDKIHILAPRNSAKRQNVRNASHAIAQIKYSSVGSKIKGIDTCSNENGCRPEVFGQAFRFLADYKLSESQKQMRYLSNIIDDKQTEVGKCLRLTYHAGEDFIDIVDGLRAIDESIIFCGLRRGDRIGHALALGIEPFGYYQLKNNVLIMPKQDLLDNFIWFLEKTSLLELDNHEIQCRNSIRNLFLDLCNEIYGEFLAGKVTFWDEHTFYEAWTLRGDKPEFYLENEKTFLDILENRVLVMPFDKYGFNHNREIKDSSRRTKDIRKLYYAYHYDKQVREKGKEYTTFRTPKGYVSIVKKLQDMLIKKIADKGIGIETNPSSNYLIGTIQKYEEHPIVRFNSRKLVKTEEVREAICVSINTDDQGVFDTCLENEYALMARALEKAKDKEENRIYTIEDIYEWIDYVRKMGNEQSFR